MINFRPNKKGFTLVEEVVSILLIGILIATASGIMMSTLRIFTRNVVTLNAQEKGIAVMNQLEEHIKYASEISGAATDTLNSPYKVTLKIEKGADNNYYLQSSSTFKQYSDSSEETPVTNSLCSLGTFRTEYSISKAAGSDNAVVIDLKVYRGNGVYYSDKRTVRLMNENADIKLTSAVDQEHELYIGSIE